MIKTFDYIQSETVVFCYRGKNEVVEIAFDTRAEADIFTKSIDEYWKLGETSNTNLQDFLVNNPSYKLISAGNFSYSICILGGGKYKDFLKETIKKRGFDKVYFELNNEAQKQNLIGLNIKLNESDFEKNTKSFLKNSVPFLSVDLTQGAYGTVGPLCVPRELPCPFCVETRTTANDLLHDFHVLAKSKNKEITEYFADIFFTEKLIKEAVNECYFEALVGRSNLRNRIRNYNFYTGEVSTDGILPYPTCLCQK